MIACGRGFSPPLSSAACCTVPGGRRIAATRRLLVGCDNQQPRSAWCRSATGRARARLPAAGPCPTGAAASAHRACAAAREAAAAWRLRRRILPRRGAGTSRNNYAGGRTRLQVGSAGRRRPLPAGRLGGSRRPGGGELASRGGDARGEGPFVPIVVAWLSHDARAAVALISVKQSAQRCPKRHELLTRARRSATVLACGVRGCRLRWRCGAPRWKLGTREQKSKPRPASSELAHSSVERYHCYCIRRTRGGADELSVFFPDSDTSVHTLCGVCGIQAYIRTLCTTTRHTDGVTRARRLVGMREIV